MKIDSGLFKKFIVKATLNSSLPSMVLQVSPDGIVAMQKDLSNAAMTHLTLDKSKFKELDITDKLCIKSTLMLIKSLASFTGEIEIKKNQNVLSLFNAERQIDIVLSSEEFIECNLPALQESLKTAFDAGVNVSSEALKKIVTDMSIVSGKTITATFKDKKLELTTGEKGFDTISVKMPADYKDCSAKYGELLANVINVVDDKINLAMKQDFPIQILETVDGITAKYIVAPLTEQ
jgi:hypothetical protein